VISPERSEGAAVGGGFEGNVAVAAGDAVAADVGDGELPVGRGEDDGEAVGEGDGVEEGLGLLCARTTIEITKIMIIRKEISTLFLCLLRTCICK
jgi:hypothetical protein